MIRAVLRSVYDAQYSVSVGILNHNSMRPMGRRERHNIELRTPMDKEEQEESSLHNMLLLSYLRTFRVDCTYNGC